MRKQIPTSEVSVISGGNVEDSTRSVIDAGNAKAIAARFLEQYHVINGQNAVLEDKIWIVTASVSLFNNNHVKKIRIDANSGKILDYKASYWAR